MRLLPGDLFLPDGSPTQGAGAYPALHVNVPRPAAG